jgi:LEA14-like dessication related protein
MNRPARLAAMLVATFAMAACASLGALGGFKEPIVNFRDLRVTGLGLTGGSLDVYLSVYNPNGFKLDATRLTYRLLVGENELGTGALDSRFTVQDRDSSVVRIPVNFTYTGIGGAARQMMQSGSVPYTVTGDVTVATPLGNFTRPYTGNGRFSPMGGAQNNPR